MLGAIAGDIIGSRFEKSGFKFTQFKLFHPRCSFTDDTVLTIAVADALLHDKDFEENIKKYALLYPNRGYGGNFIHWMRGEMEGPYNSWGNGSAMRVSPIAFTFDTLEDVLTKAKASAIITHNHPEGVKGAQAVAAAIFLARQQKSKEEIRDYIQEQFAYKLGLGVKYIRPFYRFDVSCQGSVPESIIAFLDANSLEEAIRLAVSFGGDADTMACIAGAIAEAYYGPVPKEIEEKVRAILPTTFNQTIDLFYKKYLS
ncbi:MAG: ADP-ribosylglycohydrolase family protein [Saprospiraceae bacterium]|nr:ADP-ribosylglycohydrolase family protein [Saprospiraceae bacterium]